MSGRQRKLVVAGLVTRAGEVLITRRRADQAHPLAWEFPGGKIESGESPETALARELREELGVRVRVGRIWDVLFHAYPDFDVLMLVYRATLEAGERPRCREVEELAWVSPDRLGAYDILPADAPLVARLAREGAPSADE
jgi:8-oxo-dGTP diphosphatase